MIFKEILEAALLATVGSAGVVGIMFYFLRRYLEGRLKEREAIEARRKDQRLRRSRIEDKREHAEGRLLFWLYKAIVTGTHNGDLAAAYNSFELAEAEKKDLDREIIADAEV